MALNPDDVQRLGRSAGESTATGALQRLEQSVANFRNRNVDDVTNDDVALFRVNAEEAFAQYVAACYALYTPQ